MYFPLFQTVTGVVVSPLELCGWGSRYRWSESCWQGPQWSLQRWRQSEISQRGRSTQPTEVAGLSSSGVASREAGGLLSPPYTRRPLWGRVCWLIKKHRYIKIKKTGTLTTVPWRLLWWQQSRVAYLYGFGYLCQKAEATCSHVLLMSILLQKYLTILL